MSVLDESKYPHIYALAFILGHGEHKVGALKASATDKPVLDALEQRLAAMPFRKIVEYANGNYGVDPVGPEFSGADRLFALNRII